MAISQALCTSFKSEMLDEQHDIAADTFKIALYTSSTTITAATATYASASTPTNQVANGSGYTTGGATLASGAVSTDGTTVIIDWADPSWTSASFTAAGALIYNTTNSNKAVAVLNFGGDFTVTSGTFTIVFPAADASNGLIRFA